MGHRLFRENALGPTLHRQASQIGPVSGVGGDGDDVRPLSPQHLLRVFVDRFDTVAFCKDLPSLAIPLRRRHQFHFGAVIDGLGVGGGQTRCAGVVVVVKPAVHVHLRRRTLDVVHVPHAHALRQVVQHAHPSQSDYGATVLSLLSSPV